jgi:hypothetical protein
MKNSKIGFYLSILFIVNSQSFASSIFNDPKKDIENTKTVENEMLKSKLNNFLNKIENQSVVTDKNLIYYRPDEIKRREPNKYIIWTRADVVSFDNNQFLYIVPEGYKVIHEKEGEIYINYEPTEEEENLVIE